MIDASTVSRRARAAAGELVVPAMMLLFVGAYWSDATGLSAAAVSFPLALTGVLGVAIVAIAVMAFLPANADGGARPAGREKGGSLAVKTWLIVALPVPLIFFWNDLGAIAVFFVYAAGILVVLGERRRLWLVALPAFLAFALVYLFKVGLYVRLPDFPTFFVG